MDPLIEAALRDQERRVLEAEPKEFIGKRSGRNPVSRVRRPLCDKGCGRVLYLGRNESRTTCVSCQLELKAR